MPDLHKNFTKKLLLWNKQKNKRAMPWKGEKDPYKIWLSEIILQQTRVEQGLDYYNRFIKAFPSVEKLATSSPTKVFKLWEGLGYYTRCKNLILTAKFIAKHYHGKFPDNYDGLLALKGVGPYTAAAIASFAYNLPYAVIDGNVFRVLSRYFGIETAIDGSTGKKMFSDLATGLLCKKQPGIYNQAIMDFGAILCKPKSPSCPICPLNKECMAFKKGKVELIPVKEKFIINKKRWIYYLMIECEGKVYVRKRQGKDIWENLYEFVLYESDNKLSEKKIEGMTFFNNTVINKRLQIMGISKVYRQLLTHQSIEGRFIRCKIERPLIIPGYKTVNYQQLKKLPFPRYITKYLSDTIS